jgi:sulfotransferase family protein
MSSDPTLPTFLVIGAMKSGTSSLYQYLTGHPDVFMPAKKEPHYFVGEYADGVWWRNGTWQNGLDWYRSLFEGGESAIARGEASTTYSKWPDYPGVARRIADTVPDVRLVYVVRDPIQRMRSHYQHDVVRHAQRRTIDKAFGDDPGYLNASRYGSQVAQYLEHFDASQLLVVRSDDLRTDRAATVARIYRFIGVADDVVPETLETEMYRSTERRVHTRTFAALRGRGFIRYIPSGVRVAGRRALTRPPVDELPQPRPETVQKLREELREEMEGLRPFLGADFDGWGLLEPQSARTI